MIVVFVFIYVSFVEELFDDEDAEGEEDDEEGILQLK